MQSASPPRTNRRIGSSLLLGTSPLRKLSSQFFAGVGSSVRFVVFSACSTSQCLTDRAISARHNRRYSSTITPIITPTTANRITHVERGSSARQTEEEDGICGIRAREHAPTELNGIPEGTRNGAEICDG